MFNISLRPPTKTKGGRLLEGSAIVPPLGYEKPSTPRPKGS